MKISILIPNYNGEELLKKNLPRVVEAAKEYKDGSVEIIIIDDCSTDKSVESIKYYVSSIKNKNIKLKVIENDRNVGFAPSVNRGVREAGGEIIILVNTDVVPQRDFIFPLIEHFKDQEIFAVGCLDKSIENGKVILRGRGIGRWQRGFLVHSRGEVDKQNTLWVSGGSGAFRKAIWEKLGGFSELYKPFYWEDIDLSYRALKSGYKILFEPKSSVVHKHEEGVIKKIYSPFQIKTVAYKNQFIFAWRNATDFRLRLLHIIWLPYHLIKAFFRGDGTFFLGFLHALGRLPLLLETREKTNFVKSDVEVTAEFYEEKE